MVAVNRRGFLISTMTCAGALRAQPQNEQAQTFLAGLIPSGGGPAGDRGVPAGAAGAAGGGGVPGAGGAPGSASRTSAARLEYFWRAGDECSRLGVHNIEVNTTNSQIVQTYDTRLSEFKDEMSKRNLRMVGFAMYAHSHETDKRRELIEDHLRVARFLKAVGGRYIAELLAPAANLGDGDDESYRKADLKAIAANINEVGKRVREETGIDMGYHPEQGDIRAGIVDRLLNETDPRYFNFWPDIGHFAACGADPLEVYRKYRSRMVGTHLRDFAPAAGADATGQPGKGRMVPFGQGTVNLPALIQFLRQTKFTGCVIGEGGGGSQAMRDYMVGTLGLKL